MATTTLREQFREDPRSTAIAAGVTGIAYLAVAVLRPRWLTAYGRHPLRNALLAGGGRIVLRTWWETSGAAWAERNRRAAAELRAELGRDPTPDEQWERMEELRAEETT